MAFNPQQFQEHVLPCSEEQVDISQKRTKILGNSLIVKYETVLILSRTQRHCLTYSKDCNSADSHSVQKNPTQTEKLHTCHQNSYKNRIMKDDTEEQP